MNGIRTTSTNVPECMCIPMNSDGGKSIDTALPYLNSVTSCRQEIAVTST